MSADDPACSCACDGKVTEPAPPAPGQATIRRRVGTHGSFLSRMLRGTQAERLEEGTRPLLGLNLGAPGDATRGLMDAWASALDVLTFYEERIGNEAYLRTATERRSILELARMVGYELGAGVAAETWLQFTVDDAPGAPTSSAIAAGVQVQSVPGQDEEPQTFETDAAIVARREWNAMKVVSTGTFAWPPSSRAELAFDGINLGVRPGDLLVARSGEFDTSDTNTSGFTRLSVTGVRTTATQTLLTVNLIDDEWSKPNSSSTPRVLAFRRSTVPFAAGAPPAYISDPNTRPPTWTPVSNPTIADTSNSHTSLELATVEESATPGTFALIEVSYVPAQSMVGGEMARVMVKLAPIVGAAKVATTHLGVSGTCTRLTFPAETLHTYWGLAGISIWVGSVPLTLSTPALTAAMSRTELALVGDYSDLPIGGWLTVSGTVAGTTSTALDVVRIGNRPSFSYASGVTTVVVKPELVNGYDPSTVVVNANVVAASHGETVAAEVLGSGDGTVANQEFVLRRSPLTWLRSVPSALPALVIQVSGITWTRVPSLYAQAADARVYTVRLDDDGTVRIRFGDGVEGARLPTGTENIVAAYRTGVGTAGEVDSGQLRLLKQRPLGVKSVSNPVRASGAADPEALEDARRNAPVTVLTFDRVVSLRDYADYARSYSGVGRAAASIVWKDNVPFVVVSVTDTSGAPASAQLCADVHDALENVRDPAAMAFVVVPARVVTLRAELGVYVRGAYDPETVLAQVESDTAAAFAFSGRDFAQAIGTADLVVAAHRVAGVEGVEVRAFGKVTDVGSGSRAQVTAGTFIAPEDATWSDTGWQGAELVLFHPKEPVLATELRVSLRSSR